jgi:hypothetical protein
MELEEVYAAADTPEQAVAGFKGSLEVLHVVYGYLLQLESVSAATPGGAPEAAALGAPATLATSLDFDVAAETREAPSSSADDPGHGSAAPTGDGAASPPAPAADYCLTPDEVHCFLGGATVAWVCSVALGPRRLPPSPAADAFKWTRQKDLQWGPPELPSAVSARTVMAFVSSVSSSERAGWTKDQHRAGCGTGVDKMSKVFNFSVNETNLKRISNGW